MNRKGSKSRSQKKVTSGLSVMVRRSGSAMDRRHGLLYSPVVLVLGQKLMPEEELGNNQSDYLGEGVRLAYARVESAHVSVPLGGQYLRQHQQTSRLTVDYLKKGVSRVLVCPRGGEASF